MLDERPTIVAPGLASELARLAPGAPVRITAIAARGAEAAAERLLLGPVRWHVERRAPGVYDVRLPARDVDILAAETDTFSRLDLGGRLFGAPLASPEARAEVAVVPAHGDTARARVVTAGEIATLLLEPGTRSIEVRRVL
jgi:hypothetical protein